MSEAQKESFRSFDINEGAEHIKFPSLPANLAAIDIEGYARTFETLMGTENPVLAAIKSLGAVSATYTISKAIGSPPSNFSYGRMSYMPDSAVNGGVVQWPGINPDSLKKIARENIAPQLVIGMRVDDVIRYSSWSSQLWRPGWCIEPFDPNERIKAGTKKDIQEAIRFLHNSNIDTGYTDARGRDQKRLTNFQRFLTAITRDTLTYDMIAVWTEMDVGGKVKAYASLPAGNIRFCTVDGYNGNPDNFAVAVDDGGRVIQAFNRDQLTTYVRNIRSDPDVWGYGWPEIEIAARVIKGFQNALDLNCDIFDRNAVANGILTISGGAVTQRQLDLLNRLITNMKKGITKSWALPVIGLQGDSKLEIIDLAKIKGNEAYYKEFMNMLAGALATLWRFPVRRLGYHISGSHKDNEPLPDGSTQLVDDDDPGLAPLLQHLETVINEYLLWTRWPHLRFRFTGKNPKEDSREYEARSLARTWGERRQETGLPSLMDLIKKPKNIKKGKADSDDSDDDDSDIAKARTKIKITTGSGSGPNSKDSKESSNDPSKSEQSSNDLAEPEKDDGEEEMTQFHQNLIKAACIMENAPIDPNLAGVYQTLIGSMFKADAGGENKDAATPDHEFTSKKDPAKSEGKGHQAGVRRDSKAESG